MLHNRPWDWRGWTAHALGQGVGYVAEARALFQRADNQPSGQVKLAASKLIEGLKDLDVWDGIDILVLPLAEADSQSHSLNWRQDAYNLTAVNSPVCAAHAWTGDGLTSYLDTGLSASAAEKIAPLICRPE